MHKHPNFAVNGRAYHQPAEATAVVCIDGFDDAYLEAAIARDAAPFLARLAASGLRLSADAAMPTFTNTNNASIVTGVAPTMHGIVGNYLYDRDSGAEVMMNDARFLRAPTILAAAQESGLRVGFVTAKAKLFQLLSAGLDPARAVMNAVETHGGRSVGAGGPRASVDIYSAEASLAVLDVGLDVLRHEACDLLYLSTTDYIQHAHAPDSPVAIAFMAEIDARLHALDAAGVRLVVTADHGMNAKTDAAGAPNVIMLGDVLEDFDPLPHVVLPITDPHVRHHGALGSFAQIYCAADLVEAIRARVCTRAGVDAVLTRDEAATGLDLPHDRTGDLVVLAGRDTVLGKRTDDHDLSALDGPLRSHGGRHEQRVPFLTNRRPCSDIALQGLRNFDAFHVALNMLQAGPATGGAHV